MDLVLDTLWPTRHVAAVAYGLQWLVFLCHAMPYQSERLYDLTGAVTYFSCTMLSLALQADVNFRYLGQRQQLVSLCFLIWSGRLGLFLFSRIQRDGVDRRFNRIRYKPVLFLAAWMMQGTWCYLVGLSTYLLNTRTTHPSPLTLVDAIGFVVWAVGLSIQAIADGQKRAFRLDPGNKDEFIRHGLWAISRHPNYFGELVLHTGLAIVAANGLEKGRVLAVVPPLFTSMLLLFVSGIPPLEKHAEKKWGDRPDYREYVKCTGILVPYPSSFFVAAPVKPAAKAQ